MPDPAKRPQSEAKRLRKSVRRRRQYVENLRGTIAAIGADPEAAAAQRVFAELLAGLADRELEAARAEEDVAKELEGRRTQTPFLPPSHPDMIRRVENARRAMAGRCTPDRVAFMLEHLDMTIEDGWPGDVGKAMTAIESRLGLTASVNPANEPRMLMGARVDLSEKALFGSVRFG